MQARVDIPEVWGTMADRRSSEDIDTSERNRALGYALLSILMAGMVALGVWYVVAGYEAAVQQVLAGDGTAVVVAARDLEPGTLLGPDDLALAPNSARLPSDSVFTDVKMALGETVGDPILVGEAIRVERLVAGGADLSFHELIDRGHRAISIQVDREAAVGGLLRPGHFVDVNLITKQQPAGAPGDWVLVTLLQGVRVIAVDQEVAQSRSVVDARELQVLGQGSAVVTLEVEPSAARALALATVRGQFYLTLRSMEDQDRLGPDEPLASSELLGLSAPAPKVPTEGEPRKRSVAASSRRSEPGVLFIRGSKATLEFPPTDLAPSPSGPTP